MRLEESDYTVQAGQVYRVDRNEFKDKAYLVEVEEILAEYWEKWDDGA